MWKLTKKGMNMLLAAGINHTVAGNFDGLFRGAFLILLKGAPAFTPGIGIATSGVVVADFDGYAPVALTVTGQYTSQDGKESVAATQVTFTPSGSTTPNTIVALMLADDAIGTNVWAVEYLPETFELNGPTTQANITPVIQIPTGQDWGYSDVVA